MTAQQFASWMFRVPDLIPAARAGALTTSSFIGKIAYAYTGDVALCLPGKTHYNGSIRGVREFISLSSSRPFLS